MTARARMESPVFDDFDVRIVAGGTPRPAKQTLHEVSLASELPDGAAAVRRGIRAFRAHGHGLQRDGVCDGDYIIVAAEKTVLPGAIVLAELDGTLGIARVQRKRPGTVDLAPVGAETLPLAIAAREEDVVGTFLGLIRKRRLAGVPRDGVRQSAPAPRQSTSRNSTSPVEAPNRIGILRGKLGMLEATCAETRNPRLRRALQSEAQRVRGLLQNEATRRSRHHKPH